jgi:hypothetical protein
MLSVFMAKADGAEAAGVEAPLPPPVIAFNCSSSSSRICSACKFSLFVCCSFVCLYQKLLIYEYTPSGKALTLSDVRKAILTREKSSIPLCEMAPSPERFFLELVATKLVLSRLVEA